MSTRPKNRIGASVPRSLAIATALACLMVTAHRAKGEVLLKDSFGFAPITAQGGTRLDAAGNFKGVVLHSDLSGLRAEFPNNSSEVWRGPGGHGAETWGFSVSSADPYEAYGTPSEPTPEDNGTMTLLGGLPIGLADELLDFTPPAGPFKMSLDVVGGGITTAIGFTSSDTAVNNNFATFGQIWLVLHGGAGQGGVGAWELHTNGTSGPSVSGTTLLGGYNPLALSYDPATHTVRGSVNGVPTPALSYTATGITAVGFEGVWTVNNFIVQTGAIADSADFDQDGDVDGADFLAWQQGLGAATDATLAQGDANGDVAVTAADFTIWQAQFGQGAPVIRAVPEPATLGLFAVGATAALWLRLGEKLARRPQTGGEARKSRTHLRRLGGL